MKIDEYPGNRARQFRGLTWRKGAWIGGALLLMVLVLVLQVYQQQELRSQVERARSLFASELALARMCWLVDSYDAKPNNLDCDRAAQLHFSEAGWPVGGREPGLPQESREQACDRIWAALMLPGRRQLALAETTTEMGRKRFVSQALSAQRCRYALGDDPRLSFHYDRGDGSVK